MAESTVECYSGHTYAQEPRALSWQGQRYTVIQIEQRWQSPTGPVFWVRTRSGDRFELQYHERQGQWLVRKLPADEKKRARGANVLAFPSPISPPSDPNLEDKEVQN